MDLEGDDDNDDVGDDSGDDVGRMTEVKQLSSITAILCPRSSRR